MIHPSPQAPSPAGWKLDHSYQNLPELFFRSTLPVPVKNPHLLLLNQSLATQLGLDPDVLAAPQHTGWFTGNLIPPTANPIAQAYAGHQFGHFTGLGDGRAILLGEQITPNRLRFDIQLKGSGRTPFSRGGDGRAALGPMLREYLISEAMHALNIPTTRSLAVATTGETVKRSENLPGAILTRVASSHIRVGTFQWAAAHQDTPALRALADHTRLRHFPHLSEATHLDFFHAVMDRQASLIAHWLSVGFIHGVMNTDNMALSGETIDYGPCAFIDSFDPKTTFSSIDHYGRYAYDQQASIARWNLARLAETLIPLFHDDEKSAVDLANQALHTFHDTFQTHWLNLMRAKLGLFNQDPADHPLVNDLLNWMHQQKQDFTNTFITLSNQSSLESPPFSDPAFSDWHQRWKSRLLLQPNSPLETVTRMRAHNPLVIPRNHLVEEALTAASDHNDLTPFRQLLSAITHPFAPEAAEKFTSPAPPDSPRYQTFCGT